MKKLRDRIILLLHKVIARLRYGNLRQEYGKNYALMGWGDWACDLARAVGEDPEKKTFGITIDVYPDAAATVTVKRYLNLDEVATATEIIQKFTWKEESNDEQKE